MTTDVMDDSKKAIQNDSKKAIQNDATINRHGRETYRKSCHVGEACSEGVDSYYVGTRDHL